MWLLVMIYHYHGLYLINGTTPDLYMICVIIHTIYSFLSLLRAEPISGAPVLLPIAMDKLLDTVRNGLIDAQLRTGDEDGNYLSLATSSSLHVSQGLIIIIIIIITIIVITIAHNTLSF